MSDDDADFGNSGQLDDELALPKATLVKMIKDILPPDVACAKETQNLLMDSCVEFIHLLASQANEICEQTTKKTISPEHLLQSLTQLGFDSYIEEVKQAFGEHKQELKSREKKKSAASKFAESGMSVEELARQQEELFKAARERYQQHMEQQEDPTTPKI